MIIKQTSRFKKWISSLKDKQAREMAAEARRESWKYKT
jgi:putative component of toxin-antitoxin plasmid stabilization module